MIVSRDRCLASGEGCSCLVICVWHLVSGRQRPEAATCTPLYTYIYMLLPLIFCDCSLINYGKVKSAEAELSLPEFNIRTKVGRKLESLRGRKGIILCVVDVSDFDGSLPRWALAQVSHHVGFRSIPSSDLDFLTFFSSDSDSDNNTRPIKFMNLNLIYYIIIYYYY